MVLLALSKAGKNIFAVFLFVCSRITNRFPGYVGEFARRLRLTRARAKKKSYTLRSKSNNLSVRRRHKFVRVHGESAVLLAGSVPIKPLNPSGLTARRVFEPRIVRLEVGTTFLPIPFQFNKHWLHPSQRHARDSEVSKTRNNAERRSLFGPLSLFPSLIDTSLLFLLFAREWYRAKSRGKLMTTLCHCGGIFANRGVSCKRRSSRGNTDLQDCAENPIFWDTCRWDNLYILPSESREWISSRNKDRIIYVLDGGFPFSMCRRLIFFLYNNVWSWVYDGLLESIL